MKIISPVLGIFLLAFLVVAAKAMSGSSQAQPGKERLVQTFDEVAVEESIRWHLQKSLLSLGFPSRTSVAFVQEKTSDLSFSTDTLLRSGVLERDNSHRLQVVAPYRSQVWWTSPQSFDFSPVQYELLEIISMQKKGKDIEVRFRTKVSSLSPRLLALSQLAPAEPSLVALKKAWETRLGEESEHMTTLKRGLYGWGLPLSRGPYIDP